MSPGNKSRLSRESYSFPPLMMAESVELSRVSTVVERAPDAAGDITSREGYIGTSDINTVESGLINRKDVLEPPARAVTKAVPSPTPSFEQSPREATTDDQTPPRTAKQRRTGLIHFIICCFVLFLQGWNDGGPGALLPTMQARYDIGFIIVSMIFVAYAAGYITGGFSNVYLSDKLGFGKTMFLGSIMQSIAYSIQAPAPVFPVFACAYFFAGFGLSLQNAGASSFVGALKSSSEAMMGICMSAYGLGAFLAPLVATQFAKLPHWSYFFLVSLGLNCTNAALVLLVFRLRTYNDIMADAGFAPPEATGHANETSKYRQLMRLPTVHLTALFTFIYVGTEVTLGGWIVTFVIDERGGGSSSGYLSSGFFGGLALGRILLLWVNKWIGEKRVVMLYTLICIALQVTVWKVPSLIQNAVAVSIIGLLMGPMYPIMVSQTRKALPPWLLTGGIGWIGGIGQSGSAVLPFITGVLSSRFGISSLQPFVLSMLVVMGGTWFSIAPRATLRRLD
ncbi:major facilitator superfamily domain-containing protein [Schizophyllum amplum]|uniref:Major facilitator superfamily domain-containing protein n=1 Tax=Schizophyllum amplum TaxID=97359 RepID=A0A550CQD5_9AGAR|nr:major facilitator superfamily domain-containing protein [Auriculariopsis ampla]